VVSVPGFEDGCVKVHQDTSSGVTVTVRAVRMDWLVTIAVHGFLAEDPEPAVFRLVSAALDRLTQS
jgi:hypothetical protein